MKQSDVLTLMDEPFGRKMLASITRSYEVRRRTHDESIGDNAFRSILPSFFSPTSMN